MKITSVWILTFSFILFTSLPSALADKGHPKVGHHSGKPQHKETEHGKGKRDASCWMSSLNEEQRAATDKMRLELKKVKSLLMAKITVKKVELASLVTQDSPDQHAINKKIDEILELKKEKLQKKYAYKVNIRNILTPEQRLIFDKQMFKKALHGKGHGHKKKH